MADEPDISNVPFQSSNQGAGGTPPPAIARMVLVTVPPSRNNGADVAPATITRVFSDTCVNVKVHLDGHDTLWLTSIPLYADRAARDAAEATWREQMGSAVSPQDTYHAAYWPPRV